MTAPNTMPLGCMTTAKRAIAAFLMSPAYAKALAEAGQLLGTRVTLQPLRAVYTAEQDGVKSLPYAELLAGGSDPSGGADDDDRSQERTHEIGALIHNGGEDSEVVTEQLEIHALAVQRLFTKADGDGHLAPFLGATVRVGATDYSPVEKKSGVLMKACLITLTVTTFD